MSEQKKPVRPNTDSVADILGPELAAELDADKGSKAPATGVPKTEVSAPMPAAVESAPADAKPVAAPAASGASPAIPLPAGASPAAGDSAGSADRFAVAGLPMPPTDAAAPSDPIPASGAPPPTGVAASPPSSPQTAAPTAAIALRGSGIPIVNVAEPAQVAVTIPSAAVPLPSSAAPARAAVADVDRLATPAPDLSEGSDGSTTVSPTPTLDDPAPSEPAVATVITDLPAGPSGLPASGAADPEPIADAGSPEPTEVGVAHVPAGATPTMIVDNAVADAPKAAGEGGLVVFDPGAGEEWPRESGEGAEEPTLIGRSEQRESAMSLPTASLHTTVADLKYWFAGQPTGVKAVIAGGAGAVLLSGVLVLLVVLLGSGMRTAYLVATQPLQSGPGGANTFPSVAILERNERVSVLEDGAEWVLVRDDFGRVGYVVTASLYEEFPPTPQGETFTLCRRRPGEEDVADCHGRAARQFASCRHRCESADDDTTCLIICTQLRGDCEGECEALPVASAFDSETYMRPVEDEDTTDTELDEARFDGADPDPAPDEGSITDSDESEASSARKKKPNKKKSKRRKKRKKR